MSEAKRGVPNSVLRGALFAAIQGQHRTYLKEKTLHSQQGTEIRYTGMQLDQSDLDVFEQAVHLAREHPLGTNCHFTSYGFLKSIDRSTGKSDRKWLHSAFIRLTACATEIQQGPLTYFGPMLIGGVRDESDPQNRYVLAISPALLELYDGGWTTTDWEQRKKLKGKPLALWLHGFYSSHAAPYPLSVEYLHELCGSGNNNIRDYKQQLVKALKDVSDVNGINDFDIKNDLVSINNAPSDSQKRHLSQPEPRRK